MKRLIALCCALSGLFMMGVTNTALATTPAIGVMTPGIYGPSEGVPGAPAGSCAAEPTKLGCPAVSEIVVSAPTEALAPQAYGLTPAELTTTPNIAQASGNEICAVFGRPPNVSEGGLAHTRAENTCFSGYGVQYTELISALEKQQLDGSIQWRGSDTGTHYGAGTFSVDHYAGCNGRSEFNWLGYAYAYTVINGTGYAGSNQNWRRIPCN